MILSEDEVEPSLARVKAAFPRFVDCQFINEKDKLHDGFCLWGQFVVKEKKAMPRTFFVTFQLGKFGWAGDLTIGQHSYYWSSADVGDAHLLGTDPCESLEAAITALKGEIANLFSALSS